MTASSKDPAPLNVNPNPTTGEMGSTVEVLVFQAIPGTLTYSVPEKLRNQLQRGHLVRISLRNRIIPGLILGPGEPPSGKFQLKPVVDKMEPAPLPGDLVDLLGWVRHYYAASWLSVLEAALPAAVRKGMTQKTIRLLSICKEPTPEEWENLKKRAPRQASALEFLIQQSRPIPRTLFQQRTKITSQGIQTLIARNVIREEETTEDRLAYATGPDPWAGKVDAIRELTPEQQEAVSGLLAMKRSGDFGVALLQGVTGSGKTEVYLRLIEEALQAKQQVLFLLPEIALAPQSVSRIREKFEPGGHKVVVWHSHLSDGERVDAWRSAAEGKAAVVVGARSALFAPLPHLGLIIVDEEHEQAYKQDKSPRYHGRDAAVYRAWRRSCLCILGSATPSLESYHNVKQGKYQHFRLTKRVVNRPLPLVHIVDMRQEFHKPGPGFPILSKPLHQALRETFEAKQQAILFINRRGFSRSLVCPSCGYCTECPDCSVPMTYHLADQRLRCHFCGTEKDVPDKCPGCGCLDWKQPGIGTQKVEQKITQLFPDIRMARIDADTMRRRHRFREIFDHFASRQIDLLIGTQMIAKGLDFPGVTLVGMIDADLSLHLQDFRAQERTFQLVVQVAGRAGRGSHPGQVFIQTFTPHAEALQFARQDNADGFLEQEWESRRSLLYPPFTNFILHTFQGESGQKVEWQAEAWVKHLRQQNFERLGIQGPVPAPVEKIQREYRYQVWYQCPKVPEAVRFLTSQSEKFTWLPGISHTLDVNPFQTL